VILALDESFDLMYETLYICKWVYKNKYVRLISFKAS